MSEKNSSGNQQKRIERRNRMYQDYVERITPTPNLFLQMAKAFVTGGTICLLGQIIVNVANNLGCNKEDAATVCSILLILLSLILTGFNIYPSFANWGGAGALVPITGFANGVAASAIEYKAEGQVFGIGASIFKIAGPVILYGIFSSWLVGVIYWLISLI